MADNKNADNKKEVTEIRKRSIWSYIAFVLFGIVIILIASSNKVEGESNVWLDVVIAIGQAFIIGPTISLILDLPSMVGYFKKITLESLISREYLKSLPRDQLVELRKECTGHIHLGDSSYVEPGLINLDESVCELLTKPYHERYRQNVTCRLEGDFVSKKHHVEELIINPLGNKTTKQPEGSKTILYKEEGENIADLFKVLKYTVIIDDKEEVDILKQGLKLMEVSSDSDMNYNTQVVLLKSDGGEILFEFSTSLKIERVYEVRVPKNDITYVKRLNMPAKSFRLDYHFSEPGIKLVGSCFGTLSYSDNGTLKIIHEDNHVSVESYNWLLPGNGVIIVTV